MARVSVEILPLPIIGLQEHIQQEPQEEAKRAIVVFRNKKPHRRL
jgi:hypothetical protein